MTKIISTLLFSALVGCAASATTDAPPPATPTPEPPAQAPTAAAAPATTAAATAEPAAKPVEQAPSLPQGLHHHAMVQEKVGFYGVLTPPGYEDEANKNKRYPIIVILHGSGSNELRHGSLAEDIGRDGVIYILPRAPYPHHEAFAGGEHTGWTAWPEYPSAWGEKGSETFPEKEMDKLDPSKLYTSWIADCIKDARKRYRASWDKAVVVGHSQGAAFAHLFAARYPWMVKAYVAYAGSYKETLEGSRGKAHLVALGANKVSPFLIHHEGDTVVGVDGTKRLDEMMNERKLDHKALVLPGEEHKMTDDVKRHIRMFTREQCCNETPEQAAAAAAAAAATPAGAETKTETKTETESSGAAKTVEPKAATAKGVAAQAKSENTAAPAKSSTPAAAPAKPEAKANVKAEPTSTEAKSPSPQTSAPTNAPSAPTPEPAPAKKPASPKSPAATKTPPTPSP